MGHMEGKHHTYFAISLAPLGDSSIGEGGVKIHCSRTIFLSSYILYKSTVRVISLSVIQALISDTSCLNNF